MDPEEQIQNLAEGFSSCAKLLTAIGDETRQHLILEMMKMGKCSGVRVGEITEKNKSLPSGSIPPSANHEGCGNCQSPEGRHHELLLF